MVGYINYLWHIVSLVAQLVKNLPTMREIWVRFLGWEDPLETERPPTLVFWPGEFHGLYSPQGRRESDTTERLSLSDSNGVEIAETTPEAPKVKY